MRNSKNVVEQLNNKQLHPLLNKLSSSFIIHSDKMRDVLKQVEKVAHVSTTVLLLGESGVGKEMVAKAIHQSGSRSRKPFIKVNCGAIPENLLESELFGYKRGAFTGADPKGKAGVFTQANEGILFLDEIAELPLNLQVKLLRVIQEKEVTPIGGIHPEQIDVQIIAATNKNLDQMVEDGIFREDLYYRLNVVPIYIPPLRERSEDIPFLCDHFVNKFNECYRREVSLTSDAIELLKVYPWYGNVRELENVIERAVVTSESKQIDAAALNKFIPWKKTSEKIKPIISAIMPLQEAVEHVEEQLIMMAMKQYKSLKLASQALGISQPTMSRKYQALKAKLDKTSREPANGNEKGVLEEELDKQLRSVAIVTAASIRLDDIRELDANLSVNNPAYHKLQKMLTMIREQEGKIEWNYIWKVTKDNTVINLVTDKKLKIEPGEQYIGPPEMIDNVIAANQGSVRVTPKYIDKYGEWKSSIAPIKDETEQVIAILGVDFSVEYIETEIRKLSRLLKIK